MILYLADWKSAIENSRQISGMAWYLHAHSPQPWDASERTASEIGHEINEAVRSLASHGCGL